MTNMKVGLITSLIAGLTIGQLADAQRAPTTPVTPARPAQQAQPAQSAAMTPDQVYRDIEMTVGFVPQFMRSVSDAQLPSFWMALKNFQMNENTALDNRTKELIGLAVASQIPCMYCVEFHTEAARAKGATDQQIREAIGMASVTRMASTVLNGSQVDNVQFKKDLARLMKPEAGAKAPASARRAPTR